MVAGGADDFGRHAEGKAIAGLGQLHIQRPSAAFGQARGFAGCHGGGCRRRVRIGHSIQQRHGPPPRGYRIIAFKMLGDVLDGLLDIQAVMKAAGARLAGGRQQLRGGKQRVGAGAGAAVGGHHGAAKQLAHQRQIKH